MRPDLTYATPALAHVDAHARGGPMDPSWRVTLHFHPDRLLGGVPILQLMALDGRYRSQFETGTSNGGLTAHPGGDRWNWESRLFGGAYDAAPASARPVYGSLNHRMRVFGGSCRFGSSYLRLAASVLGRTTFCYPDSAAEPVDFGTAARMGLAVLADADEQDLLNDYIEAHVHGGVRFDRDVEAFVLDECYRGTAVEEAAGSLDVPVEWHPGFWTTVAVVAEHPEYRGPEIVAAAARVAKEGVLTPRVIGSAARARVEDEQVLKRVWHYTARFGAPLLSGRAMPPGPPR